MYSPVVWSVLTLLCNQSPEFSPLANSETEYLLSHSSLFPSLLPQTLENTIPFSVSMNLTTLGPHISRAIYSKQQKKGIRNCEMYDIVWRMYVFLLATERKAIQKLQGEIKQIKKQLHQQNKTKNMVSVWIRWDRCEWETFLHTTVTSFLFLNYVNKLAMQKQSETN